MSNAKCHRSKGYSIIEMLVVIFVFSILAVVLTQSIALVLKSTTKSENTNEVRANVEYAMSVMERTLRNAKEIDTSTGCGSAGSGTTISFFEQDGSPHTFSCILSGGVDVINSSVFGNLSNRSADFDCTVDVFTCSNPDTVGILLIARDPADAGALGARVSVTTRVLLRSKYNN